MTVSNIANSKIYPGDNTANPLTIDFEFFDTDELDIVETIISTGVESILVIGIDYTVAGGAGNPGSVTPLASRPDTVNWTVTRNTALTQDTDYSAQDTFPEQSHEDALDKQMLVAQDVDAKTLRAVRISASDDQTIDMTLPLKADRASKSLIFDANGAPQAGDPVDPGTVFFSNDGEDLVGKTNADMRSQLSIIPQVDSPSQNRPLISFISGNNDQRPNAATAGDGAVFISSDHLRMLVSNGTVWKDITYEFAARDSIPGASTFGGRLLATTDSAELFIDDGSSGFVPINVASRGMMQGFKVSWSSITLGGCGEGQCSSEPVSGLRHFLSHATGMEKETDNTWAAGDGNGGWPDNTVTLPFGGWIHFFAIGHIDGIQTDFGWDTSIIATNLRADAAVDTAGFTKSFRRIYSTKTLDDGGGTSQDLMRLRQQGDYFYWDDPSTLINDVLSLTASSQLFTLLNAPLGIESQVHLHLAGSDTLQTSVSIASGIVTGLEADDGGTYADGQVPMMENHAGVGNGDEIVGSARIHTDTLQRIRAISGTSTSTTNVMVMGWMDDRERFA